MEKVTVLDHGYIALVESWGSDEAIISAARMSTNKGFQGWGPKHTKECKWEGEESNPAPFTCTCPHNIPGDEKLLRYLYEHKHATPFEMAGIVIEVQAPIFVFREWMRHRTQSFNEMSARYVPLPNVNYTPSTERLLHHNISNKQAASVGRSELTENDAMLYRDQLERMYSLQEDLYQTALEQGVPKELARVHLPVGRYSRMRASANLRNWLAFLTLRMDSAAQWEIRQYANEVGNVISQLYPRTWELFIEKKG